MMHTNKAITRVNANIPNAKGSSPIAMKNAHEVKTANKGAKIMKSFTKTISVSPVPDGRWSSR